MICGLLSGAAWASSTDTQAQINSIQNQIQTLNKQIQQLSPAQQKDLQQKISDLQFQLDQIKAQQLLQSSGTEQKGKLADIFAPRAPFVFATPYLGTATYDASDLITNWPSINEDTTILEQRKKVHDIMASKGRTPPDRPVIDISGYVEGNVYAGDSYESSAITSGISLSAVELDVLAEVSPWASAYIAIDYNSSPAPEGYKASNSVLYVDRAFLTIGNLSKSPFYGTIGQINVPFGNYSNFFISDPLTLVLGKTKEVALELGFTGLNGFYGSVYTFGGEAYVDHPDTINNGGLNAGYKYANQIFNMNVGAGVIMNIADSKNAQGSYNQGLPSGYASTSDMIFAGFGMDNYGAFADSEHLDHNVPGLDAYANFSMYGHYSLFAEYVTALRSFAAEDLSYNGQGAMPWALNLELGYSNIVLTRPYTLAVGYQQSGEALGLDMPEYSFVASAAVSIWRSTVEKIEYRYDTNYDSGDTASGGGLYVPGDSYGSHKNTVQAVIDFYF